MGQVSLEVKPGAARRTMVRTAGLSVVGMGTVLQQAPFLAHVAPEKLAELAKASYLRPYTSGQEVVRQGEYGHTMFVLLYGQVTISARTDQGEELTLATLTEPGSYFGELALLGRARRNATVRADAESALIEIEKTRIEQLDKEVGGVLEGIEAASARRSILTYLHNHRYFTDLPGEESQRLAAQGELRVHERGGEIFRQGEPADVVLVIKKGVTKLVQVEKNKEGVEEEALLGYFNAGDVVGLSSPWSWPATLLSMGYVEVIAFPRRPFKEVEERFPALFERFHRDHLDKVQTQAQMGRTVQISVGEILTEGAHEGLSLLIIDLNLCIRCGNCTRSCQARHGHAKMTRRGKKVVRRQDMRQEGSYQPILVPTSCRHCVNPECMIGCPTGAIHRTPEGEVDVHGFCIGCSSCANRCPWGNITMVPTPGRVVDGKEMKQIASKCNLCAGYEDSNCVNNCPTGAILRVEPTSYFEELQAVLGRSSAQQAVGGKRTKTERVTYWERFLAPAVTAILAAVMIAVYASALSGYSPWSTQGMVLGGMSLGCMVLAGLLAVRRRLNRFRVQLGMFRVWARAHFWLGGLMLLAVLLHSNFSTGGLVTSMLVVLLAMSVGTGFFGVLYYRWLPKVITRLEGDSQVEEDLLEERAALARRQQELLKEESPEVKALARRAEGLVGSSLGRLRGGYDRAKVQGRALEALREGLAKLEKAQQRAVEQVVTDASRAREVRAALWTYGVRRAFFVLHIGLVAMLMALVAVHVVAVLFFWA